MLQTIPPDTIDIWIAFPEAICDPSLLERYELLMTPEERQRQRRYRYASDRHEALVTRALVRTVLSSYVAESPEAWRFEIGAEGKPEIALPGTALRFNLSHTRGMIVCAVTLGRDLGIDVEYLDRDTAMESLARRKFAASEAEELLGLPEDARRSRFFDYWTLKESYVKAHGLGLTIPLDAFSFRVRDEATVGGINRGVELSFTPGTADDPAEWAHWLIYPNPTHRIAVTLRARVGREHRLRFFRCVPLVSQTRVELPIEIPPMAPTEHY